MQGDPCPLYPPKADIGTQPCDVRFVPKTDILRRSKIKHYTITSSDMESKPEGYTECLRGLKICGEWTSIASNM
jgi:hypothetical protein